MTDYDADDLFAGPGGWDVAARDLGLETLGYELDPAACATRRAAGLATVEGDVRKADPLASHARGLIASPPCQTFSMAGKGAGRGALGRLAAALRSGWWFPEPGDDERTTLVLEPYRWIHQRLEAGRPYEWLAFEQVAPVLPIWEVYAEWLRGLGYGVATGVLSAEQYGVPQTRKRAVLVARLGQDAALPAPTHSRYYPRTPDKLDEGVLPWVSMAEALGWAGDDEVVSNYTKGDTGLRGVPHATQPASTVTSKVDRVKVYRASTMPNAALRRPDQPAPTIAFGHDAASAAWLFAGAGQTAIDTAGQVRRAPDQPAHTVTGKGTAAWVRERPSTTVNCDPRISRPGRHDPAESGSQQRDAVRVSVEEAAALQSFPPGYPWQGTSTAQYQQVGNAFPPTLARAVLAAATA